MKEVKHEFLTNKYTKVLHEEEFSFNAPHHFEVRSNDDEDRLLTKVDFQEGPIKENGINGCTNEDLIIMAITRLQGFQNSEFNCRENEMAISKLEGALLWLRKRTIGRENRGVEGTHTI